MAAESSNSKLRNSSSFPNLLLSCLNFLLFILSSSSIAPILLLKTPPTSLGFALLISSSISIFSSIIGFYTRLTHLCFMTHLSFLFAALASQTLSFFALFAKEKSKMSKLKSPRDPREAKVLVRLECGILMVMLVLQVCVMVLSCAVHRCWVKEYRELERMASKRSRRVAENDEDLMENGANVSEVKGLELNDKVKSKTGF